MSNASALQALEYEAEATFGEDITTFATHRLPCVGPVMLNISRDKIEAAHLVQNAGERTPQILGPFEGGFTIKLWARGHGTTTVGSPTIEAVETFMGLVLGTAFTPLPASTTLTGGTATVPLTTSSGTFTAGALCRIGVLGDGRGNGQVYPIATHVTTSLTLLAAMDTSPTNGDVLAGICHMHMPEDPTNAATAIAGTRFRFRSGNIAYEMHGCWPRGLKLTGTKTGAAAMWEVDMGCAWFRETATSGISTVTSNQYNPAVCTTGSLFLNDVGTATRTKRTCRDFTVDISMVNVALEGPGGVIAGQKVIGAKRLTHEYTFSWVEDADTATASPVLPGYFTASGATRKHLSKTFNSTPGSQFALYAPAIDIVDKYPIQYDDSGVNRYKIIAKASTGATTTSELTKSSVRFGYG